MNTSRRTSASGFSLIEVMIAAGVLSILALGFATYTQQSSRALQYMRLVVARDGLVTEIRNLLTTGNSLRNSLTDAANGEFKKCVEGGASCNAAVDHPLVLHGPIGTTTLHSGSPSNPVRYDNVGGSCAAAGPGCPLETVTTFRALCPSGQSACPQAQSVVITYTVRAADGVPIQGGSLRTITGTVNREVNDILATGSLSWTIAQTNCEVVDGGLKSRPAWSIATCPAGKKVVGYYFWKSVNTEENVELDVQPDFVRARRPNEGSQAHVKATCCAINIVPGS